MLIACRPSRFDLEAIGNSVRLCKVSQIEPHVVLTHIEAQGTMADEARRELNSLGVQVVPRGLGNRAAFRHCKLTGLAVTEYEPKGKAAREARALYVQDKKLIGKGTRKLDRKTSSRLVGKSSSRELSSV